MGARRGDRIRVVVWCGLGWVSAVAPAQAQIVADPSAPANQQPSVLPGKNGVPVVDIQTPSAGGVSRNTYGHFDVDSQGAILNNARADVRTVQGGLIKGNPYLVGGTARVILNEVNSSQPSQLHGYVEVGGDRAQVVIANPAGIDCDGCDFINAERATLTTGKPVFNGANLDAYRGQDGRVRVLGRGLDSSQANYTDIVARSVEVNAGLWAQQLRVVTGQNTVRAADLSVAATAPSSGTASAPAYGLDVAALGGMYAGKITLVGTEAGVGVRNAGAIGAQAGDVVVTADGRLENRGTLAARGNTQLRLGGEVQNRGVISANRTLQVSTPGQIDNQHGSLNASRLDLSADGLLNSQGRIEQAGVQGLHLQAQHLDNHGHGQLGGVASSSSQGATNVAGAAGASAATTTPDTGANEGGVVTEPLAAGQITLSTTE